MKKLYINKIVDIVYESITVDYEVNYNYIKDKILLIVNDSGYNICYDEVENKFYIMINKYDEMKMIDYFIVKFFE